MVTAGAPWYAWDRNMPEVTRDQVFCPHINSSCLCLKSERELEYRFSVKHFLLFMWCFCVYVLSSRRRTEEHSHLPRLNLIKSTCEGLCSTHIFYLESAGCCCTIHQSSTSLGLLYMLKNCPDRRTDVCSSTCECMSPFHKLPSLCSLRFVLTCRPGLKLIRILSEENLKERIALSQSCPFIWCQEIHFHVWTAHTATEADSVAQRLCLHCPPTASSPLLL